MTSLMLAIAAERLRIATLNVVCIIFNTITIISAENDSKDNASETDSPKI